MLALALCSTNMPLQTIFPEVNSSANMVWGGIFVEHNASARIPANNFFLMLSTFPFFIHDLMRLDSFVLFF